MYNISFDRSLTASQWRVHVSAPMGYSKVQFFSYAGDVVKFLASEDMPESQALKLIVFIMENSIESVQTT